ncbi:unnamed protein product [Cochlearia groenlandica]
MIMDTQALDEVPEEALIVPEGPMTRSKTRKLAGAVWKYGYETVASELVVIERDAFEVPAFKAVSSEVIEEEPLVFEFKGVPSCEAADVIRIVCGKLKRCG